MGPAADRRMLWVFLGGLRLLDRLTLLHQASFEFTQEVDSTNLREEAAMSVVRLCSESKHMWLLYLLVVVTISRWYSYILCQRHHYHIGIVISTYHHNQNNTTQHNTTQHNTTQHNTTQDNTRQDKTTQHNTTQHNTTQHNTTQHNTTQHNTTQHNTVTLNDHKSAIHVVEIHINATKRY